MVNCESQPLSVIHWLDQGIQKDLATGNQLLLLMEAKRSIENASIFLSAFIRSVRNIP